MLILRIVLLGIILLVIPALVGTLFLGADRHTGNLPFAWISGQMLLWAGFEVITVPLVLRAATTTRMVHLFAGYMAAMTLLALLCLFMKRRGKKATFHVVDVLTKEQKTEKYILWAIFWGLLAFQLVQAVRMTYADGDDAYYVAVATLAEESNTMYQKSAYSGGMEELSIRYGLAPFPLWIAFLARVSGVRTVSVAHVVVPLALISMTYGIYYLLGEKLFSQKRDKLPLFLIFTELLVIFGDYSFFTAENFMIARSRQGKAALGNIMIPMLIYLLFLFAEYLQEERKIPLSFWGLLLSTLTATCLCSTLGTLLACMLVGVTGICAAICYRRWKVLPLLAASCIPCVVVALLYVLAEG